MTQLYSRLGSVGFPRKYLREIILPDWWDDEIAHNPAGYAEGLMILSRNLGLDLASMQNEAVPVGLRNLGPCKFKKSPNTSEKELMLARSLATRVVELISPAVPEPRNPLPTSASAIRQSLLGAGVRWISLANLVDYCWSVGLPVLHISAFPPGAKKMEGLASVRSGRCAVVLSKNARHSAWLLFILTHELGHIAQGHVSRDGVLVDELVDRSSRDNEEKAANAFALELLTGTTDLRVLPMGPGRSARLLARAALDVGVHEQIDPGHIVLNCAYQMGGDFFALANAALKVLEPHADAIALLQSRMIAHLDKTKLPTDTYDFILRVTRAGQSRDLPG
jgi:Zn-dependent peptidase ImmA (M78 family)